MTNSLLGNHQVVKKCEKLGIKHVYVKLTLMTNLLGTTRLRLLTSIGDQKVEKVLIFLKSQIVFCIVSIV